MAVTRLANTRSYVCVDLETTGRDPNLCDVIEVSAARVDDGAVTDRLTSLVIPRFLPISDFITGLTGITSEELEGAPMSDEVFPRLFEFIGDSPLLGHNVTFDSHFLARYAHELGIEYSSTLIDTLRISKHVFTDMEHRTLADVVDRCEAVSGKPCDASGTPHRAEHDADETIFAYEVMRPLLVERYGEDPEAAYSAISRKSHGKTKVEGISQTVEEVDESNPFFGATVCITGTLDLGVRKLAEQILVDLGATWPLPKDVSKKVDYLVLGNADFKDGVEGKKTGKLKKAEKLKEAGHGIEIVSEDFFVSIARDSLPSDYQFLSK